MVKVKVDNRQTDKQTGQKQYTPQSGRIKRLYQHYLPIGLIKNKNMNDNFIYYYLVHKTKTIYVICTSRKLHLFKKNNQQFKCINLTFPLIFHII
jgi:hypothetical protein